MAKNRYSDYLGGASSRFVQEEYNAQDDRTSPGKVVAGVALGVVALGAVAYSGALRSPIQQISKRLASADLGPSRAVIQGLRNWAKNPSDLRHGVNRILSREYQEGFSRLRNIPRAISDEVAAASSRLSKTTGRHLLDNIPSEFETRMVGHLADQENIVQMASGYAKRNFATKIIDGTMATNRAYDEGMRDAFRRISGVVREISPISMNRMSRDQWSRLMKERLGDSFNQSAVEEAWNQLSRLNIHRTQKLGDRVHSQFINKEEIKRLARLRKSGRAGMERTILEARFRAERDYYKMVNRNTKMLREEFHKQMMVNASKDKLLQKATGFRQATVGDLHDAGLLGKILIPKRGKGQMEEFNLGELLADARSKRAQSLRKLSAGTGIYVNDSGEIVDMRKLTSVPGDVLDFLTYETRIPVAGFNPLRVMHVHSRRQTAHMQQFRFGTLKSVQPWITEAASKEQAKLGSDFIRFGKHLYSFETGDILRNADGVVDTWYATHSRRGQLSTMTTKMVGATARERVRPEGWRGTLHDIGQFLDIGFQDEDSILQKLASIKNKRSDPNWIPNRARLITDLDQTPNTADFYESFEFIRNEARRKSKQFSSDAWGVLTSTPAYQELFDGKVLKFDTPEDIASSLQTVLNTERRSRSIYENELTRYWNEYANNPSMFLHSVAHDPDNMQRLETITKTIQKEVLSRIEEQAEHPINFLDFIENSGLYGSDAREGKHTVLSFILDNLGESVDRERSDDINRLMSALRSRTDEGEQVRQVINEFAEHVSPWYRPVEPETYPKFEYFKSSFDEDIISSDVLWMRGKRKLPIKEAWELIADINDQTKRDAFFKGTTSWAKQWVAGRHDMGNVTTATFIPYSYLERLNTAIAPSGLALSSRHLGSALDLAKGFGLNRYGLAYAAFALGGGGILGYVNWEIGQLLGKTPTAMAADVVAGTHKATAALRDATGVTSTFKWLRSVTPGSELLTEIPGGQFLDFTQSYEDLEEYYEHGQDPVRKGRYWTLGNTPFQGGRVKYYRPNWYQRAQADIMHTDVMYGSGQEHYRRTPFPTLRNPLAPIWYFADPYYYDRKHYYDRPYPVTGGLAELEEIPIVGSTLNATVGQILKPTRYMHEEQWASNTAKETIANINEYEKARATNKIRGTITPSGRIRFGDAWRGTQGLSPEFGDVIYEEDADTEMLVDGAGSVPLSTSQPGQDMSGGAFPRLFYRPRSSGSGREAVAQINVATKERAMRQPPADMIQTTSPQYAFREGIADIYQIGGIYGFGAKMAFGEPYMDRSVLENAYRMHSASDRFWDMELGGWLFGANLSEITRRFIPPDKGDYFNPIRNTMPSWMPGNTYFKNFQIGDPYSKVESGEYRLPGAGYEAINDVGGVTMRLEAQMLSRSSKELINYFLLNEMPAEEYDELKSRGDNRIRARIMSSWDRKNMLAGDTERKMTIYDRQTNVIGQIDAIINTQYGPEAIQIQTVSEDEFYRIAEQGHAHAKHITELNFMLKPAGATRGGILYVNEEDTYEQAYYNFDYNDQLWYSSYRKVEKARARINKMVKKGQINRFDLYDDFHKFKILADIAPFSDEYRYYNSIVSKSQRLTDEEREEIKRIRKQVSEVKKKHRHFDYQFADANIVQRRFVVKDVLDKHRFTVYGRPGEIFTLAGVDIPSSQTDPVAQEARERIAETIAPMRMVTLGITNDPVHLRNKDTYRTVGAVVYESDGSVLQQSLIRSGLATEDEDDISPAGIHARFNAFERQIGALWERFAHADTPFHTKFLQVRSPLEDYKRREVFGKNWQSWDAPVKNFIRPTLESFSAKNPLVAGFLGGMLGAAFGEPSSPRAKLILGTVGALTTASLSLAQSLQEIQSEERWIPKRRVLEREINEYFDILNFIKWHGLYQHALDMAEEAGEGNVKKLFEEIDQEGRKRRRVTKSQERRKREIVSRHLEEIPEEEMHQEFGLDYLLERIHNWRARRDKRDLGKINWQLGILKSHNEEIELGVWGAKAYEYKRRMETTLYGADMYNVQDAITAMPYKERAYARAFLENASEKEREEVLELVPRNMRRFFQTQWGMEVDERPKLDEYFATRFLPGPDWEGWRPDKDLTDVKVKVIRREGAEMTEFNLWPDDVAKAEANNAPALPIFNINTQARNVRRVLEETLRGAGLKNVSVVVMPTAGDGINIDFDYEQDRQEEFRAYSLNNINAIF
ncbi:MAG TPA: hypothetical protein GXZ48_08220 [Acholeplasmataceae bacterium]|nr:hypothetical protein [Acholeplasmataceae bacterium]